MGIFFSCKPLDEIHDYPFYSDSEITSYDPPPAEIIINIPSNEAMMIMTREDSGITLATLDDSILDTRLG